MGTRRRSGIISRFCAAGLALGLLMLAGCTDDEPDPPPPTSSTPSSPTSTEPTDSPSPDPESAEDFIRRWVEEDIKMQNTGETGSFRRLNHRCKPCDRLANLVRNYYRAGGYVKTEGWRITGIEPIAKRGDTRVVMVHVDGGPTEYRESSDSRTKHLPGERTRFQFTVRKLSDGWAVLDYVEVAT